MAIERLQLKMIRIKLLNLAKMVTIQALLTWSEQEGSSSLIQQASVRGSQSDWRAFQEWLLYFSISHLLTCQCKERDFINIPLYGSM